MSLANVSVTIALAGGFAMLLAASGTPLNMRDQIQAVRMQLAGNAKPLAKAAMPATFQNTTLLPPPADDVSLAWSNGHPVLCLNNEKGSSRKPARGHKNKKQTVCNRRNFALKAQLYSKGKNTAFTKERWATLFLDRFRITTIY